MFVHSPSFTEPQLREVIAAVSSYRQALIRLGLRPAGGNFKTIRTYADRWGISTDHFTSAGQRAGRIPARRLDEVLVENSAYHRGALKRRLFDEGLKQRACELCGQTEEWRGKRMSLILDHVNGDGMDNRLANLRIVCPNCNATFETHCGRNLRRGRPDRVCENCGGSYRPHHAEQRFCSCACSTEANAPNRRVVDRPRVETLVRQVEELGYREVARRCGVSDNAIRKWLRHAATPLPPGKKPYPPIRRALSDEAAVEAKRLLAEGLTQQAVATRLCVSLSSIKDLARGRSYLHVTPGRDVAVAE